MDFVGKIDLWRSLPVALIGTLVVGNLAWWLRKRGMRDGYTRKLNHFGLSMLSVAFLFGLPDDQFVPTSIFTSLCVVAVYGWSAVSSLPIVSSIMASNVRTRDHASGRFFVFLPLITGQIATYSALALVNPLYAKVAFCSMGLGDGLAEPVGLRYGRHQYSVYDPFWKVRNTKSVEGSSAVFIVSLLCCFAALHIGGIVPTLVALLVAFGYSACVTCIEACSPRGMDNMLIIGLGAAFLHFTLA